MTWGENATFAALTMVLAELIWRLFRILREYNSYSKHYPYNKQLRTAFTYGFTFTNVSLWMLVIIAAAVLSSSYSPWVIVEGIVGQWYLVPIYWMFSYARFSESMLALADLIRSDSGLDYATGMAASYFHGYLKLTLPTQDEQRGIRKRIENYEDRHGVEFAVKRLIILIPNSLHTRPIIESPLMERQDKQPLDDVRKDRAGVSRPYTNDVYKISIDKKPYYITVEGATPLLSYFDALNFDYTSTRQMKAMKKEILLKFYRYLKKTLEQWPSTQGLCELVFYNDYTADGRPQDVGEVLCTHIKQLWSTNQAMIKSQSDNINNL